MDTSGCGKNFGLNVTEGSRIESELIDWFNERLRFERVRRDLRLWSESSGKTDDISRTDGNRKKRRERKMKMKDGKERRTNTHSLSRPNLAAMGGEKWCGRVRLKWEVEIC